MSSSNNFLISYQRDYFELLKEFFERISGRPVSDFATVEDLHEHVKRYIRQYGAAIENPYASLVSGLSSLYSERAEEASQYVAELPGLKTVLGGHSRFLKSQLETVRRILLYVDTVLIPDPILPWIEVERQAERFPLVWLLRTAYFLLQLKPFVDEELPYPCLLIFPAWEKTVEESPAFLSAASQLIVDVVSNELNVPFESIQDLAAYAGEQENNFLSAVDTSKIFVAPGGDVGEPLSTAVEKYREDRLAFTQGEYLEKIKEMKTGQLVVTALFERISPHYHLLQHAESLNASPLLALPSHEHYFAMCSRAMEERLRMLGFLQQSTIQEIHALNRKDLLWLSNVPITDLVLLRKADENGAFRANLRQHLASLHDSSLEDTDRIAREMARAIDKLLAAHAREATEIQERYSKKHLNTAVVGWLALAGALVPSLAPFVAPAAPLALLAKYSIDKTNEIAEKKAKARSLMGIMASVARG